MSLQTARYLVKVTELSRNGEPLVGNTRYLEGAVDRLDKEGTLGPQPAHVTHVAGADPEPARLQQGALVVVGVGAAACDVRSAEEWLNPQKQLAAYGHRAARIIFQASDAYHAQLRAGVEGACGALRRCALGRGASLTDPGRVPRRSSVLQLKRHGTTTPSIWCAPPRPTASTSCW